MILQREFYMIHQLKAEGLNHSQIARRLGVDRKTVRRYLRFERDDAAAALNRTRPSKLVSLPIEITQKYRLKFPH